MTKENDVKEMESQSIEDSSSEEKEQVSTQEETQETIGDDVNYQEADETESNDEVSKAEMLNENLKRALEKERQRRKEAEKKAKEIASQEPIFQETQKAEQPEGDDEIRRQWFKLQADNYVNTKLLTDPAFKDRVDLVREEMVSNPKLTAEEADMRVKSRVFDEMVKSSTPVTINKPKQIKPEATPEPEKRNLSGNYYKDALDGKIGGEDAVYLQKALMNNKK